MNKKLTALTVLLLTAMLSAACNSGSAVKQPNIEQPDDFAANWTIDPIVIRFGHVGVEDTADQLHYGATVFAQKIHELSDGAMRVEIFPSSQLGHTVEMIGMLQRGELHMADIENASLTGFVPEALWADLPYIIQSYEHAEAVFDAKSDVSRWIRPLFADNGFRILGVYHSGFRHMMNSIRPITHPDDMHDMTMRVMASEVMLSAMNAFGAEAVVVPFGEQLWEALTSGRVNGNEQPLNLVYSTRFFEIQNYLSLTGHFYNPRKYIFSEELWHSLTPAQQLVVLDATEYTIKRMNAHHHASQERLKQSISAEGMIINEVSEAGMRAFRERGATVWPIVYEAIGGNEAQGKVILDMIVSYAQ